jgi:hypothetical protein
MIKRFYQTAAILMALLACFGGCGTKRYDNKVQAKIAELRDASDFNKLIQVTLAKGITIGMPPDMKPAKADGKRNKIPWKLAPGAPDLSLAYEGSIKDSKEGLQYYYCYMGVIDTSKLQNFDLGEAIRVNLLPRFGEGLDWGKALCPTPAEAVIDWQFLHCQGAQEFYYEDAKKKGASRRIKGVCDVFMRSEGTLSTIIVWRVPDGLVDLVGGHGLNKLAAMVAGSIKTE